MKAFIAVALGLVLIAPFGAAKERTGAFVVAAKRDGTVVQGELLAVRGEKLILREASTGQGVTAELREVSYVTYSRRGGFGRGAGKGFLFAGLGGVALGSIADNDSASLHGASLAAASGLTLGAIGAVVGGLVGALSRSEKTIAVDRTEGADLTAVASKLRQVARDRT